VIGGPFSQEFWTLIDRDNVNFTKQDRQIVPKQLYAHPSAWLSIF